MHDLVDHHGVGRSTAYGVVHGVTGPFNECGALESVWQRRTQTVEHQAALYQRRSTNDIITRRVIAMDEWFVSLVRYPRSSTHARSSSTLTIKSIRYEFPGDYDDDKGLSARSRLCLKTLMIRAIHVHTQQVLPSWCTAGSIPGHQPHLVYSLLESHLRG